MKRIFLSVFLAALEGAGGESILEATDGTLSIIATHKYEADENFNVVTVPFSNGRPSANEGELEMKRHRRGGSNAKKASNRRLEFSVGEPKDNKHKDDGDDEDDWHSSPISYPVESLHPTPSTPAKKSPTAPKPSPTSPPPPAPTPNPQKKKKSYPKEVSCYGEEDDPSSDVGDDRDGSNEHKIEFDYSVETKDGDDLCPDTIPHLEYLLMQSIADKLLFCADGSSRKKERRRTTKGTEEEEEEEGEEEEDKEKDMERASRSPRSLEAGRIVQILSTPKDKRSPHECEPSEDNEEAVKCYVLNGKITVQIDGHDPSLKRSVLAVIQHDMLQGWYVAPLNDEAGCGRSEVVDVTFLGPDLTLVDDDGEDGDVGGRDDQPSLILRSTEMDHDEDDGINYGQKVAIAIASALLLLACLALCWGRRQRQANGANDDGDGDGDDLIDKVAIADEKDLDGVGTIDDRTVASDGGSLTKIVEVEDEDEDEGGDRDVLPASPVAVGEADTGLPSRRVGWADYVRPDYTNLSGRHTVIDSHSCKSTMCKVCNPPVLVHPVSHDSIEIETSYDMGATGMRSLLKPALSSNEVQFVKTKDIPSSGEFQV